MEPSPSFHAEIARTGNKAEAIVCQDNQSLAAFAAYFGKQITKASLIPGRKKSDILLEFTDGTSVRIQNKNGTGGGRGWSVDRRDVKQIPLKEPGQQLLSNVCLKKGGERPEICQTPVLLQTLLLGSDEQFRPTYFTHSMIDKQTNTVKELWISPTESIMDALTKELYTNLMPKKTCVHLSPRLYLQRKGGGSKDHAPDNIQLKLKSMPDGMTRLLPQTTPQCVEQTP